MSYSASISLPWPPSVNHYWRRVGKVTKVSAEGRKYRQDVINLVAARQIEPLQDRLAVHVRAYPPDRRRRDLDNLPKALLDSMQHAGLYADDGQIDWLLIERGDVREGGSVEVHLREIEPSWLTKVFDLIRKWWTQ